MGERGGGPPQTAAKVQQGYKAVCPMSPPHTTLGEDTQMPPPGQNRDLKQSFSRLINGAAQPHLSAVLVGTGTEIQS